jgi:hypothetical protein
MKQNENDPEFAEKLAKLPKYARDFILALMRERDDAVRQAQEALLDTKPSESDTLLDPVLGEPIGLGVEARVTYLLDGPEESPSAISRHALRAHIVRRERYGMTKNPVDPYLEVSTSGGRIRIETDASNVVRIYVAGH